MSNHAARGGGSGVRRPYVRFLAVTALWVMLALALVSALDGPAVQEVADQATLQNSGGAASPSGTAGHQEIGEAGGTEDKGGKPWREIFPPWVIITALTLLAFSAFFSSCEVAFFSLDPLRLRSMREGKNVLDRFAAGLMEHPGNLLTSILMGNSIVNVLLGVVLASRVYLLFADTFGRDPVIAFVFATAISTAVLVFFGEITPKLFVVRRAARYARYAALPIFLIGFPLSPIRKVILVFVAFLFRVTRFSKVRSVPFMTDEEFMSLLSESEASGAIEKDEREMIQGILEFTDATVGEILAPRPDMIVLEQGASIASALALVREHEVARIPVYKESLDQITGILYAKDLLSSLEQGGLDRPIDGLLHKVHFVPETMRVAEFMKSTQRLRTHLAIVVDEYGGTEGLVTLHDALREVVGELCEAGEDEPCPYVELQEGAYRVEGGFAIDELEELLGISIDDEEHNTVAGFLMEKSEKILETGDEVEHRGVRYTVEEVDGKRVEKVRIRVLPPTEEDAAE